MASPSTVIVDGQPVQVQLPNLRRPTWCTADSWDAFTKRFLQEDGTFRCEITRNEWECEGLVFLFTDLPLAEQVDHIIPRHRGGSDLHINLQPSTAKKNREKAVEDDPSWREPSFFDQQLNMNALRASQRIAGYDEIRQYGNIWANKRHEVIQRGLVLLLAWIVRSGKLFGAVTASFAINHSIIEVHGMAAPRVRRILVLTHDSANRAQYVGELENKWNELDVTAAAPRVHEVTEGAQLRSYSVIRKQDIVVACFAMLFTDKGNAKFGDEFPQVLAQYDLIIVDEPHIATGQVDHIARMATCPVIGTTGTPHDKAHRFDPQRHALLSTWTKQQADAHDQSLKYLPDSYDSGRPVAASEPYLEVLQPESAEVMEAGEELHLLLSDGLINDHGKQLVPSYQVARRCVDICRMQQQTVSRKLAPHRGDEWKTGFRYFPHALVTVENVGTAQDVADQLNRFLAANRGRFPLDEGWAAVAHHQGDERRKIKANPLTEQSPWLRSDRALDYGIDKNCARILVVDKQSREGTSNPACLVVGMARPLGSMIEAGQRIPRAFGACHDVAGMKCPPEPLDRPYIVTHACWEQNVGVITQVLDYLLRMKSYLGELLTIDQYLAATADPEAIKVEPPGLEPGERRDVVKTIAVVRNMPPGGEGEEWPPGVDTIRRAVKERSQELWPSNPAKQKEADEIVLAIEEDPLVAEEIMDISDEITPRTVLMQEEVPINLSADDLFAWAKMRGVTATKAKIKADADFRNVLLAWYAADHKVRVDDQARRCVMSDITKQIGMGELMGLVSRPTALHKNKACAIATRAIRELFSVPAKETLKNRGRFDTVQHQHVIHRHMSEIRRYVRGHLLKDRSIRDDSLNALQQFLWGDVKDDQQQEAA